MAELACRSLAGELCFERGEPQVDPVSIPAVLRFFARADRAGQVPEDTEIVERVDIARNGHCDGAHARPRLRSFRQQRRLRIALVQVFDDRQRLREAAPVIVERGHELLRIHVAIRRGGLLALAQVDGNVFVTLALEVERDAHAVRRRGAEIAVQLHRRRLPSS